MVSSPVPHLSHLPMKFFSRTVGQSEATQNVVMRPRSASWIRGEPHSGQFCSAPWITPVWGSACAFRQRG